MVNFLITLLGVVVGLFWAGVLLWWLLITTEGVYLGRRVVIWLYDVYASRYERTKKYEPLYEARFLAWPIQQKLKPNHAPMVLDVATGTARLPRALMTNPGFMGTVVGIDLSRRMLHHGVRRVAEWMDCHRVYLMHLPAEKLPFPDNTFDFVSSLEALEFMSRPYEVIAEMVRVTRPGGWLLLTNRRGTDAKLMPGKTWSRERAYEIYSQKFELLEVEIVVWQDLYDLVWARKPGESLATRARPLGEIWQCPQCHQVEMLQNESAWVCQHCGKSVQVARDGVIEVISA